MSHTRVTVERGIKFGIDQNRDAAANCLRLAPVTHAGRAASSPEIFRLLLTVCLTVVPFEFRPRTFTIGFYGKKNFHIRAYDFGVQFSFKVARNEVENASFAQRSAHHASRIWRLELIEPAAESKRRARGRRPTSKSAYSAAQILPQCNISSNYPL